MTSDISATSELNNHLSLQEIYYKKEKKKDTKNGGPNQTHLRKIQNKKTKLNELLRVETCYERNLKWNSY